MTLLQLKYFQALAHLLHYTKTADELHISQPSLSYAISELEKELSVKLFEKQNRKIVLTIYGQQFLPYVESALLLLDEGKNVLDHLSNNSPQIVKLGYFHSISASLIPAIVEGFYRQRDTRNIKLSFTESASYSIYSQIQSGELDLGFSLHRTTSTQAVPVSRQPLYLALSRNHPLASKTSVCFNDFAHEPQIFLEHGSDLRAQMDSLFSQRGIVPNIIFEVKECNAALQYVSLNFGVAVLPPVPAMDSEKIAILPIYDAEKKFIRTIYLTWSRLKPLSPAARRIKDFIVENYQLSGTDASDSIS